MKTGSAGGTVHFPREKAKAWPLPEKNERGQAPGSAWYYLFLLI
ncbi:hypothetical protein B4135_0208 [Caldibacillus debilis]|uniref:Uncharacterized protein n=1 Tax=Caldibacillus debilis TaxID=301148 RepID=A0A150M989_9BACI|nr:hypothetical protein B4135_0208 [Caldibacillus debilis]